MKGRVPQYKNDETVRIFWSVPTKVVDQAALSARASEGRAMESPDRPVTVVSAGAPRRLDAELRSFFRSVEG